MTFDPQTQQNINLWLNGSYDEETKAEVRKLVQEHPQDAINAFYTNLSFGTGGMRGLMGVGTNRMNRYTIAQATQGLANYLKKQGKKPLSVFIGYDSRNHSKEFAEEAAKVLAGNEILVYLCKEIRPTPFVSFGCRYLGCSSAIMITASHNPPEYNGYKVYWNDGGQVLPPHDTGIIQEVDQIKELQMVKKAELNSPLIHLVSPDVDEAYLEAVTKLQLLPKENQEKGKSLKIVYTSLHGTGITLMPEALKRWGFTNVAYVKEQCIPDGNFPTTKSPNPEEKAALQLGMDLLQKTQSDLLIATDPDADRVGVVVNHHGTLVILNGNQIASICLEHICSTLTKEKKMPSNGAFIKSIVTTELLKAIADNYKKPCENVLTGFKYIAQKIGEWEKSGEHQYIFGGEESYGYLFGTYVRDKDAISSSALICEAALEAKMQGKTLLDLLHALFHKYGVYCEKLLSMNFPENKEGRDNMARSMAGMEKNPPHILANTPVNVIENYLTLTSTNLETGKSEPIKLPKSDVLVFRLTDGSKITVRPSGTEPKIKIYCEVIIKDVADVDEALKRGAAKADTLLAALKALF